MVSLVHTARNPYHAEILETLVTLAVVNDSLPLRTVDMSCNVCGSAEDVGLGIILAVSDGDDDDDGMVEVKLAEACEVRLTLVEEAFTKMDEGRGDTERAGTEVDTPLVDNDVKEMTVPFASSTPGCKFSEDEALTNTACEPRQ